MREKEEIKGYKETSDVTCGKQIVCVCVSGCVCFSGQAVEMGVELSCNWFLFASNPATHAQPQAISPTAQALSVQN